MLPLDTVNNDGVFRYAGAPWFSQALQLLAASGVHGVAVDVWWGAVERAPRHFSWGGYKQLFEMVRAAGLKVQVVLSFHACGGNVGDRVQIPLPAWVLEAGERDPDIWFTDRPRSNGLGRRNKECISLFADDAPVLPAGPGGGGGARTPLQCYSDLMAAFRDAFAPDLGGLVEEVVVGMGPCGELRYPSYVEGHSWRFPGIGEFQCYDRRALASLAAAAREAGRPEWGYSGPHDAGDYNSMPWDTGFFAPQGGSWDSEYGRFFLAWYSQALLQHADRMLSAATAVFGSHMRRRRGGDGDGSNGGQVGSPLASNAQALLRRITSLLQVNGDDAGAGQAEGVLQALRAASPAQRVSACGGAAAPCRCTSTDGSAGADARLACEGALSALLSAGDGDSVPGLLERWGSTGNASALAVFVGAGAADAGAGAARAPSGSPSYPGAQLGLGGGPWGQQGRQWPPHSASCGALYQACAPRSAAGSASEAGGTSSPGSPLAACSPAAAAAAANGSNFASLLGGVAGAGAGALQGLVAAAAAAVARGVGAGAGGLTLSTKIAGVHWWYNSASHASELTAGYYNVAGRDGYAPILELCARHGVRLTLTCVEMCDAQHPPRARCGPEGLLAQVRRLAARLAVGIAGENALPILLSGGVDTTALERVVANTRGCGRSGRAGGGGALRAISSWPGAPGCSGMAVGVGGLLSPVRTACSVRRAEQGSIGGSPPVGAAACHPSEEQAQWQQVQAAQRQVGGWAPGREWHLQQQPASAAGALQQQQQPPNSSGGGNDDPLPPMCAFTFLRLGPELLQLSHRDPFLRFMHQMRQSAAAHGGAGGGGA